MSSKIEIKNLTSLIKAKNDLEYLIKSEQIKILSKFYIRSCTSKVIKDTRDNIATLDQQLAKIKLAIQIANTTIKDEDGNINYVNVYDLTIVNRKIAHLRDLIYRGEVIFEEVKDKEKSKFKIPSKRILIKGEDFPLKKEELEKEIEALELEASTIKQKLEEFNKTNSVEVEIYDEFRKFID